MLPNAPHPAWHKAGAPNFFVVTKSSHVVYPGALGRAEVTRLVSLGYKAPIAPGSGAHSPWPRPPSSCRKPRRQRARRRGPPAPRSQPPNPARRRWPGRAPGRWRLPRPRGRPRSRRCAAGPRRGPPGLGRSHGSGPPGSRHGGGRPGWEVPAGGAEPGSSGAAGMSPWPWWRLQKAGEGACAPGTQAAAGARRAAGTRAAGGRGAEQRPLPAPFARHSREL